MTFRMPKLTRTLSLAAAVAVPAMFAWAALSPTITAQSAGKIEPPDVPTFVRGDQAITDGNRRINDHILYGRGDLVSLLDAQAELTKQAIVDDGDYRGFESIVFRHAAAVLDPDPAATRKLIAEYAALSPAVVTDRKLYERPIMALSALWTALQGVNRPDLALEAAQALDGMFPNIRWTKKLLAHSMTLAGQHAAAAERFADLFENDAVPGEFGLTYRHVQEGDAINDASGIWYPSIATSPLPFYTVLDQRESKDEARLKSRVVAFDLPEFELWVAEAAAKEALYSETVRGREQRSTDGWKWLHGRLGFEYAMTRGNFELAKGELEKLKAIEQARGPADSNIGPILRWLEFQLAIKTGDRALAMSHLIAVTRDAVGDGGLRPGSTEPVLTIAIRQTRYNLSIAVAELLSSIPPENMQEEYESALDIIRNSNLAYLDIMNLMFPMIRVSNPAWLDQAREKMGKAMLAKEVSPAAFRRNLGWYNGFGGDFPLPNTSAEAYGMIRDVAWAWIVLCGPTAHNSVRESTSRTYDTLSNAARVNREVMNVASRIVLESNHLPWDVMLALAKRTVALSDDGGVAHAKEAITQLTTIKKSLDEFDALPKDAPRPRGAPDPVWNSRQYGLSIDVIDALVAANPALAELPELAASSWAKGGNIPRMSELAGMLALETDISAATASVLALMDRLELPKSALEVSRGRTLLPMETVSVCVALGLVDVFLLRKDNPPERIILEAALPRLERALEISIEIGPAMLDIMERRLGEHGSQGAFDAFMRRLCRNELEAACRMSFNRDDDDGSGSSSSRGPHTTAILRDSDTQFHRGWPLKMHRWVPANDPLWERVERRLRQTLGLPMLDITANSDVLNNLAWSLHLLKRPGQDCVRASKLAITMGAGVFANFPTQIFSVASTLDTHAWVLSDLGMHDEALRMQRHCVRITHGYSALLDAYSDMEKAAAQAKNPAPENPTAPANPTPTDPTPSGATPSDSDTKPTDPKPQGQ